MVYANKILTPTLFISIIVIMAIALYLNQEVPACIDSPTPKNITIETNFSQPVVEQINKQLESDMLVFLTSGNSMYPIIKDNQRCACYKSSTYSVGDIVVFFVNLGEGVTGVAHEIISISDGNITTKGVNNLEADYPIKEENVMCKIAEINRYKLYGL